MRVGRPESAGIHAERTRRSFERISTHVSWGLTEDATGRIWTTDIAHGYRRIDEPASAQHSGAGYRVMFDREGYLWVATYGTGLWRVSVDEPADRRLVYRAGLKTGLSSDAIQVLLEDRDGNIWVGTSGGLHRLTRRRLTPLEDVGYTLAVAPDSQGGMWVGTARVFFAFATTRDDGARRRSSRSGRTLKPVRRLSGDAVGGGDRRPVPHCRRPSDVRAASAESPAANRDDFAGREWRTMVDRWRVVVPLGRPPRSLRFRAPRVARKNYHDQHGWGRSPLGRF